MINLKRSRWLTLASLCVAMVLGTSIGPMAFAQDAVLLEEPDSAQAATGEMKPLAVIALSGYDALIEDINFAGSLAGQPQLGAMIEPMIMGYVQGLDKTKPIGVIVQSDGAEFNGAACLPVTDLQKLLQPLQLFGFTTEDVGNGITRVETPQQPVFLKEKNGWAFVSPMQQMLESIPDDPSELLSEITGDYDLGAKVDIQNIPQPYRESAVDALEQGMQAGLRKLEDETDEQYEARKEVTAMQIEQLKQLINDIDQLTIGLSLDGSEQRAFLDFVYTAVEGSKLAEQVAMYGDSKTNFAGFYQPEAAATMTITSKMTEADIAQIEQMFGAIRKQVKAAVDKEAELKTEEAKQTVQSAMDDFLDAAQATLQTGMLDGGMVLNLAPSSLTFVAGGFIGEPTKVLSGLKKIEEVAEKDEDFPGIQWDAANHGDVNFHTMQVPLPDDEEEARQLFGETMDVAVGIGKQSVYFALGRECLDTAKSVIDTSLANPGKAVPPMEFTISLQQIMNMAVEFVEGDEKAMVEGIATMLSEESAGRDHIRIVAKSIPGGILTRFEAEEGVLRAIGMAAMQAQAQAAGAGRGF